MLMQLVCVDRRYQRMNCFNIRELQGVLKRKFFTDLVNTNDHRDFLNQSMIGLRFKTNNQLSITPDVESFFNLGTTNNTKSKTLNFTNLYENVNSSFNFNFSSLSIFNLNLVTNTIQALFNNIISMISSMNLHSVLTYNYTINLIPNFLNANFTFETSPLLNSQILNSEKTINNNSVTFSTENSTTSDYSSQSNTFLSETSNNARFTRFNNPLISYDYKCGHYLGI